MAAKKAKSAKTTKRAPVSAKKKSQQGRAVPVAAEPVAAEPERALPAAPAQSPEDEPRTVGVELVPGTPGGLEESLKKLGAQLGKWAKKGRYSRVRVKFRGRQLLPDLPLAAVVAAEGLSLTFPPARVPALLAHLAGGALLEVELVNDSEKRVQEGREALLSGDLDRALTLFREAVDMHEESASAHLNLGVALKLSGDHRGAREPLERARALDAEGPVGAEAEKVLKTLRP